MVSNLNYSNHYAWHDEDEEIKFLKQQISVLGINLHDFNDYIFENKINIHDSGLLTVFKVGNDINNLKGYVKTKINTKMVIDNQFFIDAVMSYTDIISVLYSSDDWQIKDMYEDKEGRQLSEYASSTYKVLDITNLIEKTSDMIESTNSIPKINEYLDNGIDLVIGIREILGHTGEEKLNIEKIIEKLKIVINNVDNRELIDFITGEHEKYKKTHAILLKKSGVSENLLAFSKKMFEFFGDYIKMISTHNSSVPDRLPDIFDTINEILTKNEFGRQNMGLFFREMLPIAIKLHKTKKNILWSKINGRFTIDGDYFVQAAINYYDICSSITGEFFNAIYVQKNIGEFAMRLSVFTDIVYDSIKINEIITTTQTFLKNRTDIKNINIYIIKGISLMNEIEKTFTIDLFDHETSLLAIIDKLSAFKEEKISNVNEIEMKFNKINEQYADNVLNGFDFDIDVYNVLLQNFHDIYLLILNKLVDPIKNKQLGKPKPKLSEFVEIVLNSNKMDKFYNLVKQINGIKLDDIVNIATNSLNSITRIVNKVLNEEWDYNGFQTDDLIRKFNEKCEQESLLNKKQKRNWETYNTEIKDKETWIEIISNKNKFISEYDKKCNELVSNLTLDTNYHLSLTLFLGKNIYTSYTLDKYILGFLYHFLSTQLPGKVTSNLAFEVASNENNIFFGLSIDPIPVNNIENTITTINDANLQQSIANFIKILEERLIIGDGESKTLDSILKNQCIWKLYPNTMKKYDENRKIAYIIKQEKDNRIDIFKILINYYVNPQKTRSFDNFFSIRDSENILTNGILSEISNIVSFEYLDEFLKFKQKDNIKKLVQHALLFAIWTYKDFLELLLLGIINSETGRVVNGLELKVTQKPEIKYVPVLLLQNQMVNIRLNTSETEWKTYSIMLSKNFSVETGRNIIKTYFSKYK